MTKNKNRKSWEEFEGFLKTALWELVQDGAIEIRDRTRTKKMTNHIANIHCQELIRELKEFIELWVGCVFTKQQEVEIRRGDGTGKTKLNQKEWAEIAREFDVLILHEVKKIEDQKIKEVK